MAQGESPEDTLKMWDDEEALQISTAHCVRRPTEGAAKAKGGGAGEEVLPPIAWLSAGALQGNEADAGPAVQLLQASDCSSQRGAALALTLHSLRLRRASTPGGSRQTSAAGPSRANFASRSLRRALLMPQVNTGSLYRCGKRT